MERPIKTSKLSSFDDPKNYFEYARQIEKDLQHLFEKYRTILDLNSIRIGSDTKNVYVRDDGTIKPVSLADASAENDSVYYSTTQNKLVYKDSGGVVNSLY